jgi:hypothetical protein
MVALGTKEGSRKKYRPGQPGIAQYKHEDKWYEDMGEAAFEFGLKGLSAIGGFMVGGPEGAMAAVSGAGYLTRSLTGEDEVIPADVSANLAFLISSGYEQLQLESDKGMMGTDKAREKRLGAPEVPPGQAKGDYIYKDGEWVRAPAGSPATTVTPFAQPRAPGHAALDAQRMGLTVPQTAPGPYVPNLPTPVPQQLPLQTVGFSGGQSAVPGLQQQGFSAPTSQMEIQATQAADQVMAHLKALQPHTPPSATQRQPARR